MQGIWRRPYGRDGNASEDDADKAGDGQHEGRRDGEQPKHSGVASSSIGGFIVAK